MNGSAITTVNLGKRYQIGVRERPRTLRDAVRFGLSNPWRRLRQLSGHYRAAETLWALKDVNLEIPTGKVVGIIGRNGSGKSTLLKIISRITLPSEGHMVLNGRVASLLEVGTGFHGELTGRENIYLNGCVYGMRRAEIQRKLDDIIEYAEIGSLLDTPIKRYSSGMIVRLAFSVAAHIEPEILAIDEVLAVGDARFQTKCLGQMGRTAGSGRTVLFVSHNMQAVRAYCELVYHIQAGRVVDVGNPADVVGRYLAECSNSSPERHWPAGQEPGDEQIRLHAVRVNSAEGYGGVFPTSQELSVELEVDVERLGEHLHVGFDLVTADGILVLRTFHCDGPDSPPLMLGRNCLSCQIPGGLLNGGQYYVAIRIGRCLRKSIEWVVDLDAAVSFDMEFDHGVARAWLNTRSQKGIVAPLLNWTALPTYPGDPSHSDRATCGGPAVDACAASHHESNGALPRR